MQLKKPEPRGYEQAQALLDSGAKQIPAKIVRKMMKEWAQEAGWTETMCRKLQKVLDTYSP